MIPKTLIQFWHDPRDMPERLHAVTEQNRALHPDYNFILASDESMQTHIAEFYDAMTLRLYNKIRLPAARSDLARLMLVYHYGGSYLDCSIRLSERVDSFLNEKDQFVLARRDDDSKFAKFPLRAPIMNGFFHAERSSEFLEWCINRVLANLVDGDYNNRVALATGPQVFNMGVLKFSEKYPFRVLSFAEIRESGVVLVRVPGVNNSWLADQNDGLIDKEYMQTNNYRWRKLMRFKNRFFHFSFGVLKIKD